jgi:hypothetical protein
MIDKVVMDAFLTALAACATFDTDAPGARLSATHPTFRAAKHLLSTRPILYKLDETIRGHVFCNFLARF